MAEGGCAWCMMVHVLFLMDGGGWWMVVVHVLKLRRTNIFSPTGECQVVGGINRGKWFCIKIIAFASNFDTWYQIEIFFTSYLFTKVRIF